MKTVCFYIEDFSIQRTKPPKDKPIFDTLQWQDIFRKTFKRLCNDILTFKSNLKSKIKMNDSSISLFNFAIKHSRRSNPSTFSLLDNSFEHSRICPDLIWTLIVCYSLFENKTKQNKAKNQSSNVALAINNTRVEKQSAEWPRK